MTTTQPTTLVGKSTYKNFRFEREEIAFFDKQIWSRRPAVDQKLATKARTALADLSMHPDIQVDYELDFGNAHSETFVLNCHNEFDVVRVHLTDARFHGNLPYKQVDGVPDELALYLNSNTGATFGEEGQLGFETIAYKLRQLTLDLRLLTGYASGAMVRDGDPTRSLVTQLLFRSWSQQGISGLMNDAPDSGEVESQFHIVLEVKNPAFIPSKK
ncbi:hypothetical protein D3C71_78740 [compost metagenome]